MIYVTGDTHGDPAHLRQFVLPLAQHFQPDDLLIVAGDFGFYFPPEQPDPRFAYLLSKAAAGLALLNALPCCVAFVDGNHENFPRINSFPTETWCGGTVHRMTPRLVHLTRGSCYTVQEKRIAVLGGGHSIDRSLRTPGVTWWPEEMPSSEEMGRFRAIFDAEVPVDAVITHAAPLHVMQRLRYHPGEERTLNAVLEEAYLTHRWRTWFFGHLHMDGDEGGGLYAVYRTIRTIDGRLLKPPAESAPNPAGG